MSNYVNEYRAALSAFDALTGEKTALTDQVRIGLVAIYGASDNRSIRELAKETGVSSTKVGRDVIAGEVLAANDTIDAVLVKKVCNVATAAQVRTLAKSEKAGKAFADFLKKANADKVDAAGKRPARPKGAGKEKGEAKAPKTVKAVSLADIAGFIAGRSWTKGDVKALEAVLDATMHAIELAQSNQVAGSADVAA
jgi:hypothetical protein